MKRCNHCGGRFGLIRHRYYAFRFCKAKCLEFWMRGRQERVQRERFLEWLCQAERA